MPINVMKPSLFESRSTDNDEEMLKKRKKATEELLLAGSKKKKDEKDKEVTAEAKVAGRYLEAENLVQNAMIIPSAINEIGKAGMIGAISGNPLAIKGFIAQEIAQKLSRKAIVGAINDMGESARNSPRPAMRPD